VVVDYKIIILDKIQLSSLPKVKIQLYKDILQTLTVHINFTSLFCKVIPPNLDSVNDD
jgi:hypothetical protein